jgi:hypothetical protein
MSGTAGDSSGKAQMVGAIGAFILGAILIIATFGKVVAPIIFVEQIRNERLDLFFSANSVALIALAAEMWLGVALLLGDRSRWVLYPTTLLVAFFLVLTGRTYWLVITGQIDNTYDCGCFGVFLQRTATEAFWQDLFLLVPPLLMCFAGRRMSTSRWPSWKFWIGVLSAALVVFYAAFIVGMPGDEPVVIEDSPSKGEFRLTEEYSLVIDNKKDPTAQVFQSDISLQFVVLSSQLSPQLLLDLRKNRVLGISTEMIERRAEGLDLLNTSGAEQLGAFEIGPQGLKLIVGAQVIEIRSR